MEAEVETGVLWGFREGAKGFKLSPNPDNWDPVIMKCL